MKPIKVFWNGKPLRDIYPHATKFQMFKFHLKRGIRKVLIMASLCGLIYVGIQIGQKQPEIYTAQAREIFVDNLSVKVEELKEDLLTDLKRCESLGHKESDGIIIFDSNGEPSIGQFQFQRKTVIHYYNTLYKKTITKKEAVEIAIDEKKAHDLAYDIWFKSGTGAKEWVNCNKSKGLTTQLNLINKLEK